MNSNKAVLDASAILVVIRGESGAEKLSAEILVHSVASSVNLAEVQSKLVAQGWGAEQAWEDATGVIDEVVPFSPEQAKIAGSLILETRTFGLSLGDRACLALALERHAPVYTTDRAWKKLKLPVAIHMIR